MLNIGGGGTGWTLNFGRWTAGFGRGLRWVQLRLPRRRVHPDVRGAALPARRRALCRPAMPLQLLVLLGGLSGVVHLYCELHGVAIQSFWSPKVWHHSWTYTSAASAQTESLHIPLGTGNRNQTFLSMKNCYEAPYSHW